MNQIYSYFLTFIALFASSWFVIKFISKYFPDDKE